MKSPTSPGSRTGHQARPWIGMLLALLAVLLMLFHRSFEAGQLLFSSDGPLGANAAAYAAMPDAFTGMWNDLNWVGAPAGSAFPSVTYGLLWLLGPLWFAKIYAPVTLLLLGLSAWVFFRQLGFGPVTCLLGGLAAALNTDFFSYACWGLGTLALAIASTFLALAALVTPATSWRWLKDALAGMAVGMAVMEGFDSGAILSLYVAAFVVFQTWRPGGGGRALGRAAVRVATVAAVAAFLAAQALTVLIGTQIIGIVGMEQDQPTREERWDAATQWSLPKIETLRTFVAGLFGYRMDTPDGGQYWGRVGEHPSQPELMRRHSGAGHYAGVPVLVLAWFALVQAWRRRDGPLTAEEHRWVWFWTGAAVISMALAWGRHAPFYRIVYALPYFSTIRNPIKFLHPFSLAVVILFGYGLEAFLRLYADRAASAAARAGSWQDRLKRWWRGASTADRRWFTGLGVFWGVCLLSWLIYGSFRSSLERYLVKAVPTDEATASLIAGHSILEAGWTVLLLAVTVVVLLLIAGRVWNGPRLRIGLLALGVLVVGDLALANRPWIHYWNFADKYAPNGLTRFLAERPWEHRVAMVSNELWMQPELFRPLQQAKLLSYVQILMQLYRGDWLQHGFRYYNIQSLDVVQEPRVAVDNALYRRAFNQAGIEAEMRLWELTNTRYLLALGGDVITILNQLLDPARQRLQPKLAFTIEQARPGGPITLKTNTVGPFALIEFTGALPRAALYTRWQVQTNDARTLETLVSPLWDPHQSVLVAEPLPVAPPEATNIPPGSVQFLSYAPKRIRLRARATAPSVLLLNDKHHPDWQVRVDGRPASLLRCNFLMRGVFLQPGDHEVEFAYRPPTGPLYVSLTAWVAAGVLLGLLWRERRTRSSGLGRELPDGGAGASAGSFGENTLPEPKRELK